MVLRLGHTLTSFSITLIYILFRSFEKLWIGKPFSSCSSSPERFLVLSTRLEDNGAGAALIAKALYFEQESQCVSKGGQLEPGSKCVAEILPLSQALTDRPFYSYLASATSNLADSQTRHLRRLLKEESIFSHVDEGEGDKALREGAQRARSIQAIVEEREDLKFDQSSDLPAPQWAVQVKQEVLAPAPSAPQPPQLTSQHSGPAPRPPPSSFVSQPSGSLLPSDYDPSVFPLLTRHPSKGNELVCRLKIDPWPLGEVMGIREFVVYEFVPRASIDHLLNGSHKTVAKAKPVTAQDACALKGFVSYLYGGKASGQEGGGARKEKVAVVKWGSLDFYLTLRVSEDPNPGYGLLLFV
jgi:hypothetical protein